MSTNQKNEGMFIENVQAGSTPKAEGATTFLEWPSLAKKDRRSERRLAVSHSVRVQPSDPNRPAENCITLNVSNNGFYFTTSIAQYYVGMEVFVTRNLDHGIPMNRADPGQVVQVDNLKDGRWGIAVHILRRAAGDHRADRDLAMGVRTL